MIRRHFGLCGAFVVYIYIHSLFSSAGAEGTRVHDAIAPVLLLLLPFSLHHKIIDAFSTAALFASSLPQDLLCDDSNPVATRKQRRPGSMAC